MKELLILLAIHTLFPNGKVCIMLFIILFLISFCKAQRTCATKKCEKSLPVHIYKLTKNLINSVLSLENLYANSVVLCRLSYKEGFEE